MTNQTHAREIMTNNAIARLYEMEMITKEQEPSARTLYRSCLQAYQRTTDKNKPAYYKQVEFMFDSPFDMAIQFITNIPNEWAKWQEYQNIYDDRTNDIHDLRPSIDRIDSKGHYSIDNIRADTLKGNYTEASERRRKPVAIVEVENGKIKFRMAESKTVARKALNVSLGKLERMKSRPYNLIDGNTDIQSQVIIMPYYKVTRQEFLKMEVERLQEQKAELELQGIDTRWIDDKVAEMLEQINNPELMKIAMKKRDKESYDRIVKSIERMETLPEEMKNTEILTGMREKKRIYEANGFHLF